MNQVYRITIFSKEPQNLTPKETRTKEFSSLDTEMTIDAPPIIAKSE